MKIGPTLLGAALLAIVSTQPLAAQGSADEVLQGLYEEYYQWSLEQSGRYETESGEVERGGDLVDASAEAERARAETAREYLARLDAIDRQALSPGERVNATVMRTVLEETLGDARFAEWEMPFNSDSSFWSGISSSRRFETVAEYENYISRMNQLPRYFGQHIANARAGLERGFSVPRVTLEGRDESVVPYTQVDENPFLAAFEDMPDRFSEAERERLMREGREAIASAVVPAYSDLLAFLREDYFPQARETLAAEATPDGDAYYRQQIRQYTTLDLTAEEIHRTGLEEVARIEAEMRAIMEEVGFSGTIAQFNEQLRTDAEFIADSPDELMGVSSYVAKRVDASLGDYFGFLPRRRFTIREVPEEIAPFYTAGRGGLETCWMNTYDLPSRPLYNIPALTVHECAPGHSFQMAFQREQTQVPDFRRNLYFSGMGEGWGLYTEFLAEEMGIYRTPYERFGRLSYEMWRAARLVIDTGIHHYGWSREEAIEYLASRTALSRREVGTEIDRYISWPGQALSYKLGEMMIRRLRAQAEEALGEDFDIRKFHDVVLALGSVPLPVLEQRIERFIAEGGAGLEGVSYD